MVLLTVNVIVSAAFVFLAVLFVLSTIRGE